MAIDDTVKIINVLRFIMKLKALDGNVTIKDGIMTFEDGTQVDLSKDIFKED